MKLILVFFFFVLSSHCFSQKDTLNQRDANGLKQEYWIYYGKDRPDLHYPDSATVEAGTYVNDRKENMWQKFNPDGTLRMEAVYQNNRPTGNYTSNYNSDYRYSHCPETPFDSIVVHFSQDYSYDPIPDHYKTIYSADDSLAAYVDSLCHLVESKQSPQNQICNHSLYIVINRYSGGSLCTTWFNTCGIQSPAHEIAVECAEKVFGFK